MIENVVREITKQSHHLSFVINSIKTLKSETDESQSLSIDTRTGLAGEYDPLKDNPNNYRRLTIQDLQFAQKSYEIDRNVKTLFF